MWNLFGKEKRNKKDQKISNRVDELINTLQMEGRLDEYERELIKLDLPSLSKEEKESWWHHFGIVAFQDGRDEEALERFIQAYERFPDSAMIRFSLGQQYIRTNHAEKGFQLFQKNNFPEIPREYALTQARYAYLWDRYEDGINFLRPFFKYYKDVKILDDHFLYVRGLPFFGHWWRFLAAFSILTNDFKELENVTNFVVQNCHDYDFDSLQLDLKAYKNDTPDLLLPQLEKRLETLNKEIFPTGYTRMKIASINMKEVKTINDAQNLLDDVSLSDKDFPWLEDVRTLLLAQASHRMGYQPEEQDLIDTFLLKQPLLFEPYLIIEFWLLHYQESLKIRITGEI